MKRRREISLEEVFTRDLMVNNISEA